MILPLTEFLALRDLFACWAALPPEQKTLFAEWQDELEQVQRRGAGIPDWTELALRHRDRTK